MDYILKPTLERLPSTFASDFSRWQSNNSPSDLGIVRFAFDVLEPIMRDFNRKYGVAPWARLALAEFFKYTPDMTREDRTHVIATFRGGSKSTWFSFILPLYLTLCGQYGIYHKDYLIPQADYLVLKAKTGGEGRKRLYNLSSALNSQHISNRFGDLKPDLSEVRKKQGKDQSALMILLNGFIWEAMGINQPIRGANILSVRPKGIIYDDPEHLENTKTAERRASNEDDVLEEAYGALHEENGFMVYIGNKVHEDDMLGKLLVNDSWKKQFYTLTYIDKDGIERPSWGKRHTMEYINKLRKKYEKHGRRGIRAYYKNFYNKIVANVEYEIKYYEGEYVRAHNLNWVVVDTEHGKEYRNVFIGIGLDPAISEEDNSSDAVITVVAIDAQGRRYILNVIKGKFDQRDRFYDNSKRPAIIALTEEELQNVRRIGSAEEVVRKYLQYHADAISIEIAGQQRGFFNDVADIFDRMSMYPVMLDCMPPSVKKTVKLRNCPLNFFEAGKYYIKKNMNDLVQEINSFPHSKLDTLDSIYLAEQVLTKPLEEIKYGLLGVKHEEKRETKETALYDHPNEDFQPWVVS